MKCLEIMESYSIDSHQAGIPTSLSVDPIKKKLGLANIALGRSMQSLLQSSFANAHRGLIVSTAQFPPQIEEDDVSLDMLSRSSISIPPAISLQQLATSNNSPLFINELETTAARRSSVAPHFALTESNGVSYSESSIAKRLESNIAKRSSVALPQQSSASDEAPPAVTTWESKRSSVAPRPSLAASNGAAHPESSSARRSSMALPQQSSASDEAHSTTTAMFAWDPAPFQYSESLDIPSLASHWEPFEEYSSNESRESDESADAHHRNQIIAEINARVASERNHKQTLHSPTSAESSDDKDDDVRFQSANEYRAHMAQHVSVFSVPSRHEKGNEATKVRPRLRIPRGFEHSRARLESRNDGSNSLIKPEFSRHLLGGSFQQQHAELNDHGASSGHHQDSSVGRNRYNSIAVERSLNPVRIVAAATILQKSLSSNRTHFIDCRCEHHRPIWQIQTQDSVMRSANKAIFRMIGCCRH
jgi:hypothetical protein